MDQEEFTNLCEKHIPNCAVYLNPLKKGYSPENEDEYNSTVMYTPKYFVERKPAHVTIRNSFRVCFVDGDWLEISRNIFVTRRKFQNERITILSNVRLLDEIRELEAKIDSFVREFWPGYLQPEKIRFVIKEKESKLIIGTRNGIYVYSFPEHDEDQIIFGFIESLKSFSQEYVITDLLTQTYLEKGSFEKSNELKISNKIFEIQTSIPIDRHLIFSVFHANPDDIYDEINKRTIDVARGFFREVLRKTKLLDSKFTNRTDIYRRAFQQPLFGGVNAEILLERIQKLGDEILFQPLLSEVFRELTRELNFPPELEIFLLNSLDANVFAVDIHHSHINEENLIELSPVFIESLTEYRSKINRVVSSKNINSAILDQGSKKCRIYPIKYLTKIKDLEITPPSIEIYVCYAGEWNTITNYEEAIDFMLGIIKRGVIPFSDAIHLRPFIDDEGRRRPRLVRINRDLIQLPDFSYLTSSRRLKFRQTIREKIPDLIETPIATMLEIIEDVKDNLGLRA